MIPRVLTPAVKRSFPLFILCLAALANGPVLGREPGTVETAEVVIHYDEPLGGVAFDD